MSTWSLKPEQFWMWNWDDKAQISTKATAFAAMIETVFWYHHQLFPTSGSNLFWRFTWEMCVVQSWLTTEPEPSATQTQPKDRLLALQSIIIRDAQTLKTRTKPHSEFTSFNPCSATAHQRLFVLNQTHDPGGLLIVWQVVRHRWQDRLIVLLGHRVMSREQSLKSIHCIINSVTDLLMLSAPILSVQQSLKVQRTQITERIPQVAIKMKSSWI